jgi:hypothetical protein
MFDRLAWRRECYEHYLLGLDDEDDEEELDAEEFWADPEEQRYQADIDDYETPMGELARMADDVEAGREPLPLPDGEAPFRSWTS